VKEAGDAITRGTGNVFVDLGDADAEERQTKLHLAHAINGVIARRRLSQAAAGERLGITSQTRHRASNCLQERRSATMLTPAPRIDN